MSEVSTKWIYLLEYDGGDGLNDGCSTKCRKSDVRIRPEVLLGKGPIMVILLLL